MRADSPRVLPPDFTHRSCRSSWRRSGQAILIDATGCRSGAAIAIDRENAYLRHADPKPDARGTYQMFTLSRPGRLLLFAGSAVALFLITVAAPPVAQATDWPEGQTRSPSSRAKSKFTPNKLTFRRGIPYRLHVAEPRQGNARIQRRRALQDRQDQQSDRPQRRQDRARPAPGETKDLYFIPRQAGHFKLVCPDHDWAGMTGEITVE